jgi:hypothetical protein
LLADAFFVAAGFFATDFLATVFFFALAFVFAALFLAAIQFLPNTIKPCSISKTTTSGKLRGPPATKCGSFRASPSRVKTETGKISPNRSLLLPVLSVRYATSTWYQAGADLWAR